MTFELRPGDKAGIIAPSRWLKGPADLTAGLRYLKDRGIQPVIGPHVFDTWRYMAGTIADRAADIMEFYKNPEIKAIFCVGGGDGSQYLLPHLDYDVIRQNPKPIFGHSDNNALQLGIISQTGQTAYSGFVLVYDFRHGGSLEPLTRQSLERILEGKKTLAAGGDCVISGCARGRLIGGCLSLFRNLCGTPYFPDLRESILLFEDEEEPTYKLDLMLQQISMQPGFDKVRGIVFGHFENCPVRRPDDGSIDEMIEHFTRGLNIPVIKNFPYGHGIDHHVLPLGAVCKLDADNRTLEY